MMEDINDFIFSAKIPFEEKALKSFHFQYHHNPIYKRFTDTLNCIPSSVKDVDQIPFLPISFFKTHKVVTTEFSRNLIFTSSATTNSILSQHFVKDPAIY